MAERRIEKSGRGVVCFVSNYSWLDGLSFTGMRERFLDAFDVIAVDRLNGDAYKTGKRKPDGLPDPSIFSTEHNREGIAVGTAIATLVRRAVHAPAQSIGFRDLWGTSKREQLAESADANPTALYDQVHPPLALGLPFPRATVEAGYLLWPKLPELLPTSFPGVKTSRDEFLVSISREELLKRVSDYRNPKLSDADIAAKYPSVMQSTERYDAKVTRLELTRSTADAGWLVRYLYKPFDVRWMYAQAATKLLDEKRSEHWPLFGMANCVVEARQRSPEEAISRGAVSSALPDNPGNGLSTFYPLRQPPEKGEAERLNLAPSLVSFLVDRGLPPDTIFYHIVATLHAPLYRSENADALRLDWPRVPIPAEGRALERSATLGRTIAMWLDPEQPAPGVSTGALRSGLAALGQTTRIDGGQLSAADLGLTADWGRKQRGGAAVVLSSCQA